MRANGSELATDKEYNSNTKRQWSQKALQDQPYKTNTRMISANNM
jgi:hypothetical protein